MTLEAGVLIGYAVVIYSFSYIAMRIGNEGYGVFRLFFFMISLFMVINWLGLAVEMVDAATGLGNSIGIVNAALRLQTNVIWITMFLIVFKFLWFMLDLWTQWPDQLRSKVRKKQKRRF